MVQRLGVVCDDARHLRKGNLELWFDDEIRRHLESV